MLKPAPTETAKRTLTSPEELPNADIVIFDGECQFCTGQVANLRRLDGKNRLAFVSLHEPLVQSRFPDLTHEQLMKEMVVVNQAGDRFGGAAAFRYLTRRLPALWILAPIMHIPFSLPVWQWFYRQIAKRRYMLNKKRGKSRCENDQCSIHFDK